MENRKLERQQQRYPMARNLSKSNLGGVIFGCKHSTEAECLANQLFGFPSPHFSYVKNIEPGLPLFLFNYTDRKLCGIYEAESYGEMSIDPSAWTQDGTQKTPFPAQVRIRIRTQCQPLMEKQFSEIIKENYYSQHHFWFELDHEQVQGLITLFENQVINTTNNQFNVNTELVQVVNELEEKANMLEEKQDQKKEDAGNASGRTPVKKQSAGELRLHKDIAELDLPQTTVISFPDGNDDLMNFEISIRPDEGYYYGGTFIFTFQVSPSYPHEPPKVKCKTKVYHPNIDLEGNVFLNILREDWKPVLNINTIIYLLNLLFMQPNDEHPLNHEAAAVLRDNPGLFEMNVRRAMTGRYICQT